MSDREQASLVKSVTPVKNLQKVIANEWDTALDPFADNPKKRTLLVQGGLTFGQVTEKVCTVIEGKTSKIWWMCLGVTLSLLSVLGISIGYLIWEGVGIWGVNNPVGWGWAIVNFVFWVGIGHAGTLISAILFLLRQNWRTGVNRFAEAMTPMAVACAGIFPGVHIGRVWAAYWMFPVPNQMAFVAELPFPSSLGHVRGKYIRYSFTSFLVRRSHPGPRYCKR